MPMPYKCYIPKCRGNYDKDGPKVSTFGFPLDAVVRGKWLSAIQRKDFTVSKSTSPTVSVGNVGQLAVDLMLSTFNAEQVAYINHPFVLPAVGPNPFDVNSQKLITSWQVYQCKERKLVIMQQRTPVIPGQKKEYLSFLTKWIKQQNFKMVVMLSSCFSQYYTPDNLEGIPMHYLCTSQAKPAIGETLEGLKWKEFNLGVLANKNHENTLPGGGISNLFHKACEENDIPLVVIVLVCWEGDNYPEAIRITESCCQLLSQTCGYSQWKRPQSWHLPYGGPPNSPMY